MLRESFRIPDCSIVRLEMFQVVEFEMLVADKDRSPYYVPGLQGI
jgi:hypothetical protein